MKQEFYYLSKDGLTQIHAVEWIPEGEVKAVLDVIMILQNLWLPMGST